MEGKGTRDLQELLDPLDPQDVQDQLDHRAMDPKESQVQREPKESLEPWDHPEKPVCLDLWEHVILVILDLMVNQESQKLDSQGLEDLREIKVSQEQ